MKRELNPIIFLAIIFILGFVAIGILEIIYHNL